MDVLVRHRWPGNIRELKNAVERIVLRATGRIVGPSDLPSDIVTIGRPQPAPSTNGAAVASFDVAEQLATRMLRQGESFWSAVYPAFMSRDLTREHLRKVIQIGLERTNGNYRLLVERFNMPATDYKRFLGFLRKHDCHLPFQKFRAAPARVIEPFGHVSVADAS